jgi:hypothetical protein
LEAVTSSATSKELIVFKQKRKGVHWSSSRTYKHETKDMQNMQKLKKDYPWIQTPLVVGAPMRLIALADMAVEISKAGTHMRIFLF